MKKIIHLEKGTKACELIKMVRIYGIFIQKRHIEIRRNVCADERFKNIMMIIKGMSEFRNALNIYTKE